MVDDAAKRVDEMIAEGLRVCREAIATYRPVAVVAAYSGGDDSIVSTHFAFEELEPGCPVFNADTLTGLAPAREHIYDACNRFGWTLEVERAEASGCPERRKVPGGYIRFEPARDLVAGEWREGRTAYEEFCLNWGFPGRSKEIHARQYQRLKQRPLRAFIRRMQGRKRGEKVLVVSGIRSDESAIRAGYKRAYAVDESAIWVNPFYWRSAADFAAYRDEFGLPSNPVKPRCGISGECCCNTFPNDNNTVDALAAIDPDFGGYVRGLERQVREVFPWGYGQSPPSWWVEKVRGQSFLFDPEELFGPGPAFQPMCVGCDRRGGR